MSCSVLHIDDDPSFISKLHCWTYPGQTSKVALLDVPWTNKQSCTVGRTLDKQAKLHCWTYPGQTSKVALLDVPWTNKQSCTVGRTLDKQAKLHCWTYPGQTSNALSDNREKTNQERWVTLCCKHLNNNCCCFPCDCHYGTFS